MNTEKGRRNLNLAYCESIVRELEARPRRLPAFYSELESAVEWLMDRTFEATDAEGKVRLAAVEMRTRLVLERFKESGVN